MKIAIVTGGTRGLGKAISIELFHEGFKVFALYTSNEEAAHKLHTDFPDIEVVNCNVSDPQAVQKTISSIYKEYGNVDCLVNNAGIIRDGYFLMMSESKWREVIDVNIMGLVNVTKAVIRIMKVNKKPGKVINISSTSGVAGQIGQVNYSATKGAIIAITKTLAKEYAADNITVNCVSPGFIESDMTKQLSNKEDIVNNLIPLKRFGKPEEVGYLVSFLASQKANYITGKNFVIDGGMIND